MITTTLNLFAYCLYCISIPCSNLQLYAPTLQRTRRTQQQLLLGVLHHTFSSSFGESCVSWKNLVNSLLFCLNCFISSLEYHVAFCSSFVLDCVTISIDWLENFTCFAFGCLVFRVGSLKNLTCLVVGSVKVSLLENDLTWFMVELVVEIGMLFVWISVVWHRCYSRMKHTVGQEIVFSYVLLGKNVRGLRSSVKCEGHWSHADVFCEYNILHSGSCCVMRMKSWGATIHCKRTILQCNREHFPKLTSIFQTDKQIVTQKWRGKGRLCSAIVNTFPSCLAFFRQTSKSSLEMKGTYGENGFKLHRDSFTKNYIIDILLWPMTMNQASKVGCEPITHNTRRMCSCCAKHANSARTPGTTSHTEKECDHQQHAIPNHKASHSSS